MYGHHHGGWGWGGGWGGWGGPYMRRAGFPLFGGGWGMGSGLGGGGGLMGDLLAGGLGYMMGRGSARQNQQYPPQYQQQYQQYPPQYQQQYQQPAPQYQPPPAQGSAASAQNARLAQLRLLGQMRQSGTLTEDEFQAEKQKILNGE